jgi:hypothetical protein
MRRETSRLYKKDGGRLFLADIVWPKFYIIAGFRSGDAGGKGI